jgi:3-methylcrotonyl-CoA carboxylase alpha subunit
VAVRVRGRASVSAEVSVAGDTPVPARAAFAPGALVVSYGGQTRRYAYAHTGTAAAGRGTAWLGREGQAWALAEEEPLASGAGAGSGGDSVVRSPMPGTVLAVKAAPGEQVRAGQPLLIVEAMKMEHTVSAPFDGTVAELSAAAGQQVALDEPLAVITPADGAA